MLPDWVSPWWQAVCLPKRWDVCGVSVPSLSVWHTFALENTGNGYLCGGPCTIDDAASLLLIASGDMAHGQRLIMGDHYRLRRIRAIYRKLKSVEWAEVHAACIDYVEACLRTARRWYKTDATGAVAGAPYQFHVLAAICSGYNMTDEQAWNTPYVYARMLYDARAEALGQTSVATAAAEALADENIANGIDVNARN